MPSSNWYESVLLIVLSSTQGCSCSDSHGVPVARVGGDAGGGRDTCCVDEGSAVPDAAVSCCAANLASDAAGQEGTDAESVADAATAPYGRVECVLDDASRLDLGSRFGVVEAEGGDSLLWTAPADGEYVIDSAACRAVDVTDACTGVVLARGQEDLQQDTPGGSLSVALEGGQAVVLESACSVELRIGSLTPEANCRDAVDDDGDGWLDCDDTDCANDPRCARNACPPIQLGSALGEPILLGTTADGDDRLDGSCSDPGVRDIAVGWTAPASGRYAFGTAGTAFNHRVYLLDADCDGRELDCSASGEARVELEAGQRVAVVLDGGGYGAFALSIRTLD